VVDDGSTDHCYDVAAGIPDPRLSVWRHPINRGANAARNTGALAANGEWIVFLDNDDELAPVRSRPWTPSRRKRPLMSIVWRACIAATRLWTTPVSWLGAHVRMHSISGEPLGFVHLNAAERLGTQRRALFRGFAACAPSYYFLEGDGTAGIRQELACLRATPLRPEVWALLFVGAANAGAFARVRSWRRRR
jgi:hypothetical protein